MPPPSKHYKKNVASDKIHNSSKKIFKPQTTSNATIASKSSHEDDAPDFPRGGGRSLSRKELDEVRAEVDAEFESEVRVLKKKGKGVRNRVKPEDDEIGSLFGEGISGKLPRFVNKITLKNVSPGMKLWGVISEVNEKDIVVSLPGGLRGLVRCSEALESLSVKKAKDVDSDLLSTIYKVGQLVSCTVLQLDDDQKQKGQRKLWLSLRLSLIHKGYSLDVIQEGMVLSAYVKSIEDHGYMLNFGLPSFSGFMPKIEESGGKKITVNTGQLVQGVVKSIDMTRNVVHLSSDPELVSNSVPKDLKGISVDLLVPGMMINARVQSVLENGILLSFLTYFTGTVDLFHLEKTLPGSNWKEDYGKNKKVNARILFVDPSTRAVGLTLNPHLVHNNSPPSLVKTGDIFENAKVIRVDKGAGLLLEIPSSPIPIPAFVSASEVADKEVKQLEKNFKEGNRVRVRVLGFKHLEGLAIGVLKASAFEGSVFTHSDVKPGMVVKAKVLAVHSFGAIVELASGVKALCPVRHMSEFEIANPRKKFQVGAELVFRVLGCKSKRITVTHKKTLVKSKLEIISSYDDASEGLKTHGWITKIESHGCFVHFYNGVQGFTPRSELGLDPGSDTSSMYHIEQVVKCRVTSSAPSSRRINLSFIMTPARGSDDDTVKPGSVVSGVVEQVKPNAVIVNVNSKGLMKGTINLEHLADNQGLAITMMSVLKKGYEFDKLLVLDMESSCLILSAKYSLVNSAQELPQDVNQVHPHSVVPGYICNIIDTGCFVRFLGRLTGFAPKHKATDDRRSDLSEVFCKGQSVRSNILDVNTETNRVTVSLKQSLCSSTDTSFLQEYFILEDKIARMQLSEPRVSEIQWAEDISIGSTIEGKVHEKKDFGVSVSFEKYNDVYGFITQHQLGGVNVETGSVIRAAVLDVSKMERLVDLSLKSEFVEKSQKETKSKVESQKKKRKREAQKELEVNQTVNAVVQIVKDTYLVLSIPENNSIGYASLADYNTQRLPSKQFVNGQSVVGTIMALPSPSSAGRLLLLLKSVSELVESSSSKRAKKKSGYNVGSLVQAEITEINPLELKLKFGPSIHGRVHITEVNDDENVVEDPFSNFKVGQTLTARIVSKANKPDSNKNCQWDLSLKPSLLAGSVEEQEMDAFKENDYSIGQHITGFINKVDKDWIWLSISRSMRAQLYILDTSADPTVVNKFETRFKVGQPFSGYILSINKEKKTLRLVPEPLLSAVSDRILGDNPTAHIYEGRVMCGRVSKIYPGLGGLLVQIDPQHYGKVHFTELTDLWVPEPLSEFSEGQFVRCKVLEVSRSVNGIVHFDLSLRSFDDQSSAENRSSIQRLEKIDDVKANMAVQGYIKNVTPKGCFIMLSRKLDAKILISNLSDGYVEDLEKEFPIGKLVNGKVLTVEPLSKRIEVTLRTSSATKASKSDSSNYSSLRAGNIISGRIKRVESYGLFITIDRTNMVGLCHVSELSEDRIDNIEGKYKAGERVTAKILKVEEERQRISLGMKSSYLADDKSLATRMDEDDDNDDDDNDDVAEENVEKVSHSKSDEMEIEFENTTDLVMAEVKSRASVPPLEVSLDDDDDVAIVESVKESKTPDTNGDNVDKNKKGGKKVKEDREKEIRAAEERLLENDVPRNADEYEKLVRTSPNNSFVWIKYMVFMLSLADVEKARAIAERALRTINVREESEKLNIWVAYFNLENEYGNPPEEAVTTLFQRALQFCDKKKLHLALLGMYEKTEQHNLTDELLGKMLKKFKGSCKVWLRRIQWLLKQNNDGIQSTINLALISLPKHKHIKFLSQTAILEFKCGVPDRGRSIFEGILREYPKRTDLWSVYLDQEIRLADVDLIRALFERATSMTLPAKKMRSLFKKYLHYEKTYGDDERTEYVKQKAIEYANTALA